MFKFKTAINGPGCWVGYILQEIDGKTKSVGGINISQHEININISEDEGFTVKQAFLLLSQLMQNDNELLNREIYINRTDAL